MSILLFQALHKHTAMPMNFVAINNTCVQVLNKQWDKQYGKLPQVKESFFKTVHGARTVFEQLLAHRHLSETVQVAPRAFAHCCASSKCLNRLNVSGLSTDPARVQHQ